MGGDSLTGRGSALPKICRPKYPTNYPLLPFKIFMQEIFYKLAVFNVPEI
jgi:prepilin signal peptidase PulO-like enzyme (type II secretory pathway)